VTSIRLLGYVAFMAVWTWAAFRVVGTVGGLLAAALLAAPQVALGIVLWKLDRFRVDHQPPGWHVKQYWLSPRRYTPEASSLLRAAERLWEVRSACLMLAVLGLLIVVGAKGLAR
jgi:hypothetical protein